MKRRGMALGLAALMTCTALFTTTANAKNKGSDEKETIKFPPVFYQRACF